MREPAVGRRCDPFQLPLEFDGPPRTADAFLQRLRQLGLKGVQRCRLTTNRAVMVSFTLRELRVHRGYLDAPAEVLRAIVTFVSSRSRTERRAAQRVILEFPVHAASPPRVRRPERSRPEDAAIVRELARWHADYNRRYFAGALSEIAIRLSGRMKSRLGQYMTVSAHGDPAEIAISRAHVRRHGWSEALHTLLHGMVHQWQAESGLDIDHGPTFRHKAREVGIVPGARRHLGARASAGSRAPDTGIGLAARD